MIASIVGSLTEAWEEVKVQKARVIMSLIGVVAAVTAMTTVFALGELVIQADKEVTESWSGREVTLTFDVIEVTDEEITPEESILADMQAVSGSGERNRGLDEAITDTIGDKLKAAMERFKVPVWTRDITTPAYFPEVVEAKDSGTFMGLPSQMPEYDVNPEIQAVDPMYATLFRLQILQGRWLTPSDENQRAVPMVINESMWKILGKPQLSVPFTIHSTGSTQGTYRIIGVVKQIDPWQPPRGYVPYESWKWITSGQQQLAAQTAVRAWIGHRDPEELRDDLTTALSASLGENYDIYSSGGENYQSINDGQNMMRYAIMAIGGLVIALGALGLLNVAVVTVRQRIREIGIRRAVGASARRIFFAVFMESVVATFVAGLVGVITSIIIVRVFPWSMLGIYFQDSPAFPISAAIVGIGVSTAVGALCGIIPAMMALKVKPINAIRY